MLCLGLQRPFNGFWVVLGSTYKSCTEHSIDALSNAITHGTTINMYDGTSAPLNLKRDIQLDADNHPLAAQDGYRTPMSRNCVDSRERGAPFCDEPWKDVGDATTMVYLIVDEIRVGVMVMQDDILMHKHWPKHAEAPTGQCIRYIVWR